MSKFQLNLKPIHVFALLIVTLGLFIHNIYGENKQGLRSDAFDFEKNEFNQIATVDTYFAAIPGWYLGTYVCCCAETVCCCSDGNQYVCLINGTGISCFFGGPHTCGPDLGGCGPNQNNCSACCPLQVPCA
jgi:hypothetical protein